MDEASVSGRRTPAQRAGDAAEDLVAATLAAAGWHLVGRQVRAGRAELDLVAVDPGPPPALTVVEVRWRGRRDFGLPEETVDRRKLIHLRRGIARLLAEGSLPDGGRLPELPARLDLVVVEPGPSGSREARLRHYRGIG